MIQICTNDGQCPSLLGNNSKIANKIHQQFKMFFSRIIQPILIKRGTKHHWVKEIQFKKKKELHLSPMDEINYEIAKMMPKIH